MGWRAVRTDFSVALEPAPHPLERRRMRSLTLMFLSRHRPA